MTASNTSSNVSARSASLRTRLKPLLVVPVGVLLTLVFFVLLAEMVQMDQMQTLPEDNSAELSLFMLQDESDLEVRKRARPEPPEPAPEKPAMPSVSQPLQNMPVTEVPTPDLDLPDIAAESSFQLDVDISQFQPGESAIQIAENPMPLSRVNPRYPRKALRRGLEGQVVLEFVVDANGDVVEDSIKIISATPKGLFEHSSVRALSRWRFQPKKQGGQGVPFRARQTLVFKLAK
ncbi:energy transducer TonB [Oceanospirillum linum]|uniref:Protein TonB n=1 Tax=Oceanospirillum linum TaxID=966 RepID=A0A1T1H9A9_OCELI|nr:energy transducer TonB [Oceanospirillum linum]OOV86310.1 hypothetical protein BTA35_0213930 [Oceanospirillum linum]SEG47339.1 outer membrane transport energization protein TonB [Oleiphilus messinensis]SMP31044.1 outer membrane transport energization protein TonB [Oceanospirillum linum]